MPDLTVAPPDHLAVPPAHDLPERIDDGHAAAGAVSHTAEMADRQVVSELAQLCDRMGIDVWEVVDAAATKPFGFASFKPGPGLGGSRIVLDGVAEGIARSFRTVMGVTDRPVGIDGDRTVRRVLRNNDRG